MLWMAIFEMSFELDCLCLCYVCCYDVCVLLHVSLESRLWQCLNFREGVFVSFLFFGFSCVLKFRRMESKQSYIFY